MVVVPLATVPSGSASPARNVTSELACVPALSAGAQKGSTESHALKGHASITKP